MYISDRPTVSLNLVLKKEFEKEKKDIVYPFDSEKIIFYSHARNAIFNAIKLLRLTSKDNVLLPSYLDDAVIEPFVKRNINLRFYKINENLEIETNDLIDKIKEDTKAIFIIHYFGFPQPIEKIRKIRKEYSVYIIEDCALAFLSSFNGVPLGDLGDISIFSFRKSLQIPDGGAMLINNSSINLDVKKSKSFPPALPVMDLLRRDFQSKLNFSNIFFEYFMGYLMTLANFNSYNSTISSISWKIMQNLDFKEITSTRIKNFKYLSQKLKYIPQIRPIYPSIPIGVCPSGYPVLIENRDAILKKLRKKGIMIPVHWELPAIISKDEFPVSYYLSKHEFTLPVYQGLDRNRIDLLIDILEKLCTK
jgi:perosamine synthetase